MASWKLDIPNTFKFVERNYTLPNKLLVAAGPTNCSPKVIAALTQHSVTPVCEEMFMMMDHVKEMLKYVFQTKNEVTLALQTSGSGGLEATITNLVDPGEKIIVASGGVWGDRTVLQAKIRNIEVIKLDCQPGEVFNIEELEKEIIKHKPVLLFITHGESSGGTLQPLEGLGEICQKYGCLLAVDAVVSLGGVPYFHDKWKIDVSVSATQKAIGAPPGLAFLTFSSKAVERMRSIKTPPPFTYNILELATTVWNCFGNPRRYYYTYNSHMISAVREALFEIVEEGLENRWNRHKTIAEKLWKGLEKLNFQCFVTNPEHRLWTLCLVTPPSDIKWRVLLEYLENRYQAVIGFGIGPSANKAIRIGLMGYNARSELVDYVLDIINEGLKHCKNSSKVFDSTKPTNGVI